MKVLASTIAFFMAALLSNNATAGSEGDRVVSVDLCADQFVLKFAKRAQIMAVSPEAELDTSLMRNEAIGIPSVRPTLEDVLLQRPTIVVRSYGGGPGFTQALERFGIKVVELGWPSDIAGVAQTIERVGSALGSEDKAHSVASQLLNVAATPNGAPKGRTALYLTPSGATTGPGSLLDQTLTAAGYTNFIETPGWRDVPLERLTTQVPDHVILGFFDSSRSFQGRWSIGRHPLLSEYLEHVPSTEVPGSWLACNTWALADVIERLRDHR